MKADSLFRAFDAAVALRDAARRFKGEGPPPPDTGLAMTTPSAGSALAEQVETRLTNVVVAALKEAFDRDHARLELERAQLDEQRRRAEEAMRFELRRHASDHELSRLRLIGAAAFVGWIASVAFVVARLGTLSLVARGASAGAWLLLLGALGAAFSAQARLGASVVDSSAQVDGGAAATASLWLLLAGLAVAAMALLF
jgi:hypothetical protein